MPFLTTNGGTEIFSKGYPHGLMALHPDVINRDLLAFLQGEDFGADAGPLAAEPAVPPMFVE